MNFSLKVFIREVVLESLKRERKKLRIFDFDDTLVKTNSVIRVTSKTGDKFELSPGDYAVYEAKLGDQFDYSDFDKLIDPVEIKWTAKILKNIVAAGSDVVILTARAAQEPVNQFLETIGIPPIKVVTLGSSDPQKKADYIEKRIVEDDVNLIEFFDDSPKNIAAVKSLQPRYPEVKIIARQIVH